MTRRKKSSSKGETALIGLIISGIGLLIYGIFKGIYALFKELTAPTAYERPVNPPQYYHKPLLIVEAPKPQEVEVEKETPQYNEVFISPIPTAKVPTVSFVAIDFETANRRRGSACAIGMCKVLNGVVVDRYVKLLRPEPFEFESANIYVHGIESWKVSGAPTIADDWINIQAFVGDLPLVAHNASFDRSVLDNSLIANGLSASGWQIDCSYKQGKRLFPSRENHKLKDFCKEYGIELEHHDAGSDAEACARLWLELLKIETVESKKVVEKVTPSVVEPTSDKLKGLTLVFTGEFDDYTREDIEDMAKSHGAFVRQSVSGKTDYVIRGNISYSGKLTKAQELGTPIITLKKFIGLIEKPKKRTKELVH